MRYEVLKEAYRQLGWEPNVHMKLYDSHIGRSIRDEKAASKIGIEWARIANSANEPKSVYYRIYGKYGKILRYLYNIIGLVSDIDGINLNKRNWVSNEWPHAESDTSDKIPFFDEIEKPNSKTYAHRSRNRNPSEEDKKERIHSYIKKHGQLDPHRDPMKFELIDFED